MLWICKEDRVRYAVGSPACPQCGSTEHWEEGQEPPGDGAPNETVADSDVNESDVDDSDAPPVLDAPPLNEAGTEPVITDKPVEVVEPRRRGAK